MEKTFSGAHPGTSKTNSVFSADRANSARKIGRTHSPGSVSVGSPAAGAGSRGGVSGNSVNLQQAHKGHLEGVLCKYTNLLQGWQNRYFVLDPELGQLQYFVNEHVKNQKPRGSLPLIGACVSQSDEAPHMFTVHSVNGEFYKLRAADAKEEQFWMNQLQNCARRHSDSSAKGRKLKGSDENLYVEKTGNGQEGLGSSSSSSGWTHSFSLLPPPSSSPGTQRNLTHPGAPNNIVTITHHKSPAAARRAKNQYPGRLLEVKEIMAQVEGQQKSLAHSIESLPARGPLSCLDHDLLLLKATSAATLSCLGECLNILHQNVTQVTQQNQNRGPPPDAGPGWPEPKSSPAERTKNGSLTPLPSTERSPPSGRKACPRALK
ncbi:hypothetical protein AAFF_G00028220 [Aldrovandia affinis]|uniref:PH domain-containing protein n=1 Tax=Aldrovandia affinis TaxID=143900 RepID=A0AAD7WGI4_9TELE|nr:hypothetical protein AAFF_G00028220 [Aldrovandia affinis]